MFLTYSTSYCSFSKLSDLCNLRECILFVLMTDVLRKYYLNHSLGKQIKEVLRTEVLCHVILCHWVSGFCCSKGTLYCLPLEDKNTHSPTTLHHVTEGLNPQQCSCGKLKSCIKKYAPALVSKQIFVLTLTPKLDILILANPLCTM